MKTLDLTYSDAKEVKISRFNPVQNDTEIFLDLMFENCSGKKAIIKNNYFGQPLFVSFHQEIFDRNIEIEGEKDTYISLHTFKSDCRQSSNWQTLNGILIDIDYHLKEDVEENLDNLENQIEKLINDNIIPVPTIITFTGRGFDLIYLFRDPINYYGGEQAVKKFNLCQSGLYELFEENNVEVDTNVKDLARVFRIPGTMNSKAVKLCRIIFFNKGESGNVEKCSLDELAKYTQKKNNEKDLPKHRKEKQNYDQAYLVAINSARINALNEYLEKKKYQVTGNREVILFLYAVCFFNINEKVSDIRDKLIQINNKYPEPLEIEEIDNLYHEALRWEMRGYSYKFSNEKFYEKLFGTAQNIFPKNCMKPGRFIQSKKTFEKNLNRLEKYYMIACDIVQSKKPEQFYVEKYNVCRNTIIRYKHMFGIKKKSELTIETLEKRYKDLQHETIEKNLKIFVKNGIETNPFNKDEKYYNTVELFLYDNSENKTISQKSSDTIVPIDKSILDKIELVTDEFIKKINELSENDLKKIEECYQKLIDEMKNMYMANIDLKLKELSSIDIDNYFLIAVKLWVLNGLIKNNTIMKLYRHIDKIGKDILNNPKKIGIKDIDFFNENYLLIIDCINNFRNELHEFVPNDDTLSYISKRRAKHDFPDLEYDKLLLESINITKNWVKNFILSNDCNSHNIIQYFDNMEFGKQNTLYLIAENTDQETYACLIHSICIDFNIKYENNNGEYTNKDFEDLIRSKLWEHLGERLWAFMISEKSAKNRINNIIKDYSLNNTNIILKKLDSSYSISILNRIRKEDEKRTVLFLKKLDTINPNICTDAELLKEIKIIYKEIFGVGLRKYHKNESVYSFCDNLKKSDNELMKDIKYIYINLYRQLKKENHDTIMLYGKEYNTKELFSAIKSLSKFDINTAYYYFLHYPTKSFNDLEEKVFEYFKKDRIKI